MRRLTVDAAHQIAPVRRRRDLLRRGLEVEDVEGMRSLLEITLLEGAGKARHESHERAGSNEPEKGAAIGHGAD